VAGRRAGSAAFRVRPEASVRGRSTPRHRHRHYRRHSCSSTRRRDGVICRLGPERRKDDLDRNAGRLHRDSAPPRRARGEARGEGRRGRRRRRCRSGGFRLLRATGLRGPAGLRRSFGVPSAACRPRCRHERRCGRFGGVADDCNGRCVCAAVPFGGARVVHSAGGSCCASAAGATCGTGLRLGRSACRGACERTCIGDGRAQLRRRGELFGRPRRRRRRDSDRAHGRRVARPPCRDVRFRGTGVRCRRSRRGSTAAAYGGWSAWRRSRRSPRHRAAQLSDRHDAPGGFDAARPRGRAGCPHHYADRCGLAAGPAPSDQATASYHRRTNVVRAGVNG
jgi:hypothetical protein